MGSKRVKGIVVEIGGNTGPLDKALEGTNKHIGNTQTKLKDVERLLKLDPKNTVLLEQKQKLLAEAVQETEDKLATLNRANEQVADSVKNYDAWKAAYDPIQAEINATSEQLKELKKQQKELSDCGEVDTDAYRAITEAVEKTNRELRDLKKRAKEVSDEFGNPVSPEQYDALQREIVETEHKLQSLTDEAKATEKRMDGLEDAVEDVADAMDEAGSEAATFGDVLKAEAIVAGAEGIVSSLKDVAEETKEYRKIMGSLDVSSESAGYSAEQTEAAYKKLYGVLADDQSAATTLANLQALGLSQADLMKLIDNAVGGWAKYGDSIPIDGLAESVNETVKAGQVTGTFADILNWGAAEGETYGVALRDLSELQAEYDAAVADGSGVSQERIDQLKEMLDSGNAWNEAVKDATTAEDFFNLALQNCSTEAERADLIMQAMSDQGLAAAAEKWTENNASMVEANEASADLQEQMAQLGELIEPIMTRITQAITGALEWFNGLDAGTQNLILTVVLLVAACGPLIGVISGVSGVVTNLSGMDLPGLSAVLGTLKDTVLPALQTAFTTVFQFIAANPVVLLIGAIVALVALIATKGDEIQAILQKADDFLQNIFARDWREVFGPVLGGILNGFFSTLKGIWDNAKKLLDGVIDFVRGVFTGNWERAWKGVRSIFEGIFGALGTIMKTPINAVIGLINKAIGGVNSLISAANKIPGINLGTLSTIPKLATGGEVLRGTALVGEAGPELLTVAGGRTIVQPLTQNNTNRTTHMGGITVNVYGAPGQSEDELADRVADRIQQKVESEEHGL